MGGSVPVYLDTQCRPSVVPETFHSDFPFESVLHLNLRK